MVFTKINFNSAETHFINYDDFMNYCYKMLGHEDFVELANLFSDPLYEGIMLPYEKVIWATDGKSGYVQRFHETPAQSKEFQIKLTNSSVYKEFLQLLAYDKISVSVESGPTFEADLSRSLSDIKFIDLNNPEDIVKKP